MDEVLRVLYQFQTAIVGIIGFTGVILTLWWNARIARESREHSIANDRRALRLSLTEELKVLNTSFVEGAKAFDIPVERGGTRMVPTDDLDLIFRANIGKLGLLSSSEIEHVLGAYLCNQQVRTNLLLISRRHELGESFLEFRQKSSRWRRECMRACCRELSPPSLP